MDHKWGRNVLALGMVSTGATLAARYVGLPHAILTNAPGLGAGNTRQLWFTSADTQTRWEVHSVGFPASLGNFPYGEPVEPDAPV